MAPSYYLMSHFILVLSCPTSFWSCLPYSFLFVPYLPFLCLIMPLLAPLSRPLPYIIHFILFTLLCFALLCPAPASSDIYYTLFSPEQHESYFYPAQS